MNAEVMLRTLSNTDVRIAEIYDKRSNNLEYVIMYFCYTPENHQQIEKKIKEYINNKETCLIACIKPVNDIFFDSEKITSLFDVHLNAASDSDFEDLIDYCISTEDAVVNCEMNDFKSQDGTEIIVSAAQNKSIEKLIENIKTKTEEKYPKVVVSLMTNRRELQISEVKSITDSITGYLTDGAQCMLNTCECMEKIKKDEIKVTLIFFEKKTQD